MPLWDTIEEIVVGSIMANRILVADSNERSREMLTKLLEIYGGDEIKIARDGAAALELLSSDVPTLVVVDANLQRIPGTFIAEIIRFVPRFHETKVALLADDFPETLVQQGMQLGVHAFLARPVDAENVKNLAQLLRSEHEFSSSELPVSINRVITALSSAARRNLSLLFGKSARILKIETLTEDYAQKTWDFVSHIELKGQVVIQVATGATNQSAQALSDVMPMSTSLNRSLPAVLESFLSGVIEKALPDLQQAFVVQVGERSSSTGSVRINRSAQYQFAIHMRVGLETALLRKQFAIPLYVAVTLA